MDHFRLIEINKIHLQLQLQKFPNSIPWFFCHHISSLMKEVLRIEMFKVSKKQHTCTHTTYSSKKISVKDKKNIKKFIFLVLSIHLHIPYSLIEFWVNVVIQSQDTHTQTMSLFIDSEYVLKSVLKYFFLFQVSSDEQKY